MTNTVNNAIPFVPENTIDPAAGLNISLNTIDALLQVLVQTVGANSPPGSPVSGARYIVGPAPTGAWAGQANRLARWLDSAWSFFDARYALNAADGLWYVRSATTWSALSSGGASLPVVRSIAANETLGLAQINTFGVNNSASHYVSTIPAQATVTWTADAEMFFLPTNIGDITITAASGVSLNGVVAGSVTVSVQNGLAQLKRLSVDAWWVGGTLSTDITVSSLNGGQLAGTRNKVINGNPLINQRGVSGTVVLAAGVYGHDRWKAGASGCTYTFATSNNITTLTISAGSLQQVIEGNNLQSGTYTLSWSGTAQGKIGAGSYSASGVTGSITGGTNTTVEFNTGTLSLVQLEFGSVATAFEHRHYGLDEFLCKRYYQHLYGTIRGYTPAAGYYQSTPLPFQTPMRAIPTLTVTAIMESAANVGTAIALASNGTSARFEVTTTAGGEFYCLQNLVIAEAEL